MKMSDLLLKEDVGGDNSDSVSPNQGHKTGDSGEFHPEHQSVIKSMTSYPEYPGFYYNMYRFGVNMAGNLHDEHDMAQQSHTANQMLTLAYTDTDREIIEKSQKNMGIKGKAITTANSQEPETTNKTSPIAKRKPNKYGI